MSIQLGLSPNVWITVFLWIDKNWFLNLDPIKPNLGVRERSEKGVRKEWERSEKGVTKEWQRREKEVRKRQSKLDMKENQSRHLKDRKVNLGVWYWQEKAKRHLRRTRLKIKHSAQDPVRLSHRTNSRKSVVKVAIQLISWLNRIGCFCPKSMLI